LERLLGEAEAGQTQIVITESIFSMDGDAADLAGLVELKKKYGFILFLDEAHGSGVYGPAGSGYAAELGLQDAVDVTVVTLSKALGCVGGAICGDARFIDAVVNYGRAWIYSTLLPPMIAAGATKAIEVLAAEPHHQQRVRDLARH